MWPAELNQSLWMRKGEGSLTDTCALMFPVPPDEYVAIGKHRHAELGPSAALH